MAVCAGDEGQINLYLHANHFGPLIVAITQTCSGDLMTLSTHSRLHNCTINYDSPQKDPATISSRFYIVSFLNQ